MRYTYPALITSAIKLVRRYKNREHVVGIQFTMPYDPALYFT